jgi:hypothetical protein
MSSRNAGTVRFATTAARISSSNRFTGASRPTATTSGSGERAASGSSAGANSALTPLSTARTRPGRKPSSISSSRVASLGVTICVRR